MARILPNAHSHSSPRRRRSFSANATLDLLRRFDPMAAFDWPGLSSIAQFAREIYLPRDRPLVRPPRRLRGVWYLTSGTLIDEAGGERLHAGSVRCRRPVYPGIASMRTLTAVRLLFFDESCLSLLLPELDAQGAGGDVLGFESIVSDTDHWLTTLAASPLLRSLYQRRGAAGWQSWLRGFETLKVSNGQELIAQGASGDYFYIVKQGVASVTAVCSDSSSQTDEIMQLAQVCAGGFFGEDALLSGQPRNARVSMPLGGYVLRGGASQLSTLVDDLWWVLARQPQSWSLDNRLLQLPSCATTVTLRDWVSELQLETSYGLAVAPAPVLQDLLLLLLVHRGYCVALREEQADLQTQH